MGILGQYRHARRSSELISLGMNVSMRDRKNKQFALLIASLLLGALVSTYANAQESFKLGADTCGGECHEAELEIWQESPHQQSFDKFDDPDDELTAVSYTHLTLPTICSV